MRTMPKLVLQTKHKTMVKTQFSAQMNASNTKIHMINDDDDEYRPHFEPAQHKPKVAIKPAHKNGRTS